MNKQETAEWIIGRRDCLKSARYNFENLWQEVSELVLPNYADFTYKQSSGVRRDRKLFDGTAVHANQMLASDLNSMMISPSAKWFDLEYVNPELKSYAAAMEWLENARRVVWDDLYRANSGFVTTINESFLSVLAIGTTAVYIGWSNENNGSIFQSAPVSDVLIDENSDRKIDTVFRTIQLNVRQIEQMFGLDGLPDDIKKKFKEREYKECYEIIHAIYPNPDYQDSENNGRFSEVFVLVKEQLIIKQNIFHEMPMAVCRWSTVSGEVYGRGPGINALADIKMLQQITRETITAAQLANRPPLAVKDDDSFSPICNIPGGIVRYRTEMPRPIQTGANFTVGLEYIEIIKRSIRLFFFNEALAFLHQQMTATEVLKRIEEAARLLGPAYDRLTGELLSPIISRVLALNLRHGKIPPPPVVPGFPSLEMNIVYMSPLAKAMRYEEAGRINQALAVSAPYINASPDSMEVINSPEAVRRIYEIFGVDRVLRTPEEVRAIEQQRQVTSAAAQQSAEAEAALQLQSMQNQVRAQDMELNSNE